MMPISLFGPDSFDAQLAALPWDLRGQLLAPQVLVIIVGLVAAVAALALIVASLADETLTPAGDFWPVPEQDHGDSLAGWFGSSCAWLCPWQPRQTLPAR